jgi:hypothetical protein
MKRSGSRFAAWVESTNQHLRGVRGEADSDQTRSNGLVQGAANGPGEVGLRCTLQRYFPGDSVLVDAAEFASVDHLAAGDRAIGSDDAG